MAVANHSALAAAVAAQCRGVEEWCGSCCRERAARAGRGAARLRRLLARAPEVVRVAVVGDSVARFNNFGVTRGVIAAMRRLSPRTSFELDYARVAGGIEPDHLYNCGLGSSGLGTADVIMLHYHAPKGGSVLEKIVRLLLALPRSACIIYVSHCLLADFSTFRAFTRHRLAGWFRAEPQGYFEQARPLEERLAEHYGLTFVSTCAARPFRPPHAQSSPAHLPAPARQMHGISLDAR